jgi:hypothetical protein
MAKFQKIGLVGNKLTFRIICDDGHEEVQTYALNGKEEETLMSEIALHMNAERLASIVPVEIEEAVSTEPVMEVSISQAGKVSVKEVVDKPVA